MNSRQRAVGSGQWAVGSGEARSGRAAVEGWLNALGAALLAIALAIAVARVCQVQGALEEPHITMEEYEERLLSGDTWPDEVCEMCGAVGAAMEGGAQATLNVQRSTLNAASEERCPWNSN